MLVNHPLIAPEHCAQWQEDCLKWRGRILYGEKAHWCADWDGLPVDETTPEELDCCHCFESA